MSCLAAMTKLGPDYYPAFLSINRRSDGVEVTVRSPRRSDGHEGSIACVTLTEEEWKAVKLQIAEGA